MKRKFLFTTFFLILFMLFSCGDKNGDIINGTLSENSDISTNDSVSTDGEEDKETDYGNFSNKNKLVPSSDREKQRKESEKSYNTGTSYTEERINEILSSAKKIQNLGGLVFPNAVDFMAHYLSGSGDDYIINIEEFLSDSTFYANMELDLENIKKACEQMYKTHKITDVYQKTESLYHNLSGDLKYCVGSYFAYGELHNITFDGNTYSATFTYKIIDYYNWDNNDSNEIFSRFVAQIVGNVSPRDLYQLHLCGMAKEFMSHGEISYEISWEK